MLKDILKWSKLTTKKPIKKRLIAQEEDEEEGDEEEKVLKHPIGRKQAKRQEDSLEAAFLRSSENGAKLAEEMHQKHLLEEQAVNDQIMSCNLENMNLIQREYYEIEQSKILQMLKEQ